MRTCNFGDGPLWRSSGSKSVMRKVGFPLRCCVAAVSVVFVCRLGANFSSGRAAEAHGSGCLCALAVGGVAVAVAVAGVCAEQL